MSNRQPRLRFWIETVLAVVGFALGVLTILVRDWFERLFDASPDNGGGQFEWVISLAFVVPTLLFGYLARREWRRTPLLA